MGWLFKKKAKEPKVPFPKAHAMDENALRFPNPAHSERVIRPDQMQAAAGTDAQPEEMPSIPELPDFAEEHEEIPAPPIEAKRPAPVTQEMEMAPEPSFTPRVDGPLFVKIDVYQRLLGEIDGIKSEVSDLNKIQAEIDNSEYNEENNFAKLKRDMKAIHDRLLQVDELLFNVETR